MSSPLELNLPGWYQLDFFSSYDSSMLLSLATGSYHWVLEGLPWAMTIACNNWGGRSLGPHWSTTQDSNPYLLFFFPLFCFSIYNQWCPGEALFLSYRLTPLKLLSIYLYVSQEVSAIVDFHIVFPKVSRAIYHLLYTYSFTLLYYSVSI